MAGGCNGWCKENPAVTSAEMYDPDTDLWSRVADLPIPLNRLTCPFCSQHPSSLLFRHLISLAAQLRLIFSILFFVNALTVLYSENARYT